MIVSEVEGCAELPSRQLAQFENFEHADFVGGRLGGRHNVSVGFGEDVALGIRSVGAEVIHHLRARPFLRMDASINNEADRAQQFVIESAEVHVGILIESEFFGEILAVKRQPSP